MSIQPAHSAQAYSPVKKAAKTVAKAAVVSAAVATTLALGARSGKFTVNENTNKVLAKALPYLEKAGNFINDKACQVVNKIAETGIKNKITNSKLCTAAKEEAGKVTKKLQDFDIKGKVKAKLGEVEEYLRTNIGKFNPDKANAADKAAETFNNFIK